MSSEVNNCEVKIFDRIVGYLSMPSDSNFILFEYDKKFINDGFSISPLLLPLSNRIYSFPNLNYESFNGLPGVFADSLPDTFGNMMINKYLEGLGRDKDSMNTIEKLCYQGTRGMGALEYFPATNIKNLNDEINVTMLSNFANDVLNNRKNKYLDGKDANALNLLTLGTSAGGARAKAIVAYNEKNDVFKSGQIKLDKNYKYYIIKFDGIDNNGEHGENDSTEYTKIEYAYYLMAKDSKIEMSNCRLYEKDGLYHFMTERFDRVNDEKGYKKIHMVTFAGLKHIDYKLIHSSSYEILSKTLFSLNKSEYYQEQLFRRMVFNVLAYNMDDHAKNFSFLMNENGEWVLSPQYDLTFSYKPGSRWVSDHQMTINGKSTSFNDDDLISTGTFMNLTTSKCKKIISEIKEVINNFMNYADIAKLGVDKTKLIDSIINH